MAPPPAGRLRPLLGNLALGAASLLVVFGGVEILLRLTGLAPARALRTADARTLETIPGLFDPGQEFVDRVRPDLPARIRINNLGFRGRDLAGRPEGTGPRILALGDSYTFGDHVDTEAAWPAVLEERLRASEPSAEVVNGGVNGFGILDQEAMWRRAAPALRPGIVLIAFSPNDISDLTRPVPIFEQMMQHARLKARPGLGPLLRVLQRTALFNGLQILAARIRVATRSHAAIPEIEPARAGPARAPEAWEAYRRALASFGDGLRRSGAKGLLILYPAHGQAAGTEASPASEILPGWAAEAGLPCLDLLPAFRRAAAAGEVLYLVPRDSHPSVRGHALAAATIAAELERLGWLESAGGSARSR